jgi:hypothetical protein
MIFFQIKTEPELMRAKYIFVAKLKPEKGFCTYSYRIKLDDIIMEY